MPQVWPAGLTAEDLDWLAEMMAVGEIDVWEEPWAIPAIRVNRGGYPVSRD